MARLVGVFNAEGSLAGELRYVLGKVTGRAHCALCDVTHGWSLRGRPEFRAAAATLPLPLELVHLDERSPAVTAASEGWTPCVLLDVDGDVVRLLGPDELERCGGEPDRFVACVRDALRSYDSALT
jgi:hypothetical protein